MYMLGYREEQWEEIKNIALMARKLGELQRDDVNWGGEGEKDADWGKATSDSHVGGAFGDLIWPNLLIVCFFCPPPFCR